MGGQKKADPGAYLIFPANGGRCNPTADSGPFALLPTHTRSLPPYPPSGGLAACTLHLLPGLHVLQHGTAHRCLPWHRPPLPPIAPPTAASQPVWMPMVSPRSNGGGKFAPKGSTRNQRQQHATRCCFYIQSSLSCAAWPHSTRPLRPCALLDCIAVAHPCRLCPSLYLSLAHRIRGCRSCCPSASDLPGAPRRTARSEGAVKVVRHARHVAATAAAMPSSPHYTFEISVFHSIDVTSVVTHSCG